MPSLGFKKQFVSKVESGDKTHSIRGKRKRAWKVGDNLRLQTGPRFKPVLIGKTTVTRVQEVELFHGLENGRWPFRIQIDGVPLSGDEADAFARRDGFGDLMAMRDFWIDVHGLGKPGCERWVGDLIHWKFPFKGVAECH